jgi:hypothetical protein
MAKQSLLDKAKETKTRKRSDATEEEIELALAWLADEVSIGQLNKALDKAAGAGAYSWLASTLREAYRNGILVVK